MKVCCTCKQVKPFSEFNKHLTNRDGHQNQCRACQKAEYRRNRRSHIARRKCYYLTHKAQEDRRTAEWRRRNADRVKAIRIRQHRLYPDKIIARDVVAQSVRSGRMQPQPCVICRSSSHLEAHHLDYSKPLDVRWLCRQHHVRIHRLIQGA